MKALRKIYESNALSDYIAELRASKAVDGNGNVMFPEVEDDEPTDEREELKEKLKEAGVQFGGNTSTAKLREMVAKL